MQNRGVSKVEVSIIFVRNDEKRAPLFTYATARDKIKAHEVLQARNLERESHVKTLLMNLGKRR